VKADPDAASDIVCVSAFVILIAMSVLSYVEAKHSTYEFNTGLFCAVMCLFPMVLRRLNIFRLPLLFVIIIEISIFLHAYGVLLMEYDDVKAWDTVTHSISSVTVALCAFYALMVANAFDPMVRMTRRSLAVSIFVIVIAFGAYWEAFEFMVDNLWGTNMQYSPWDTFRDLLCDALGGTVVAVYAYFYLRGGDERDFVEGLRIHPLIGRIVRSRG